MVVREFDGAIRASKGKLNVLVSSMDEGFVVSIGWADRARFSFGPVSAEELTLLEEALAVAGQRENANAG